MSKRVLIICLLLLGLGIAGAFDMFVNLVAGKPSINLFVLFLPTSIFLSLGMPGARLMTSIVFVVIYLFLAVCLIAPLWFRRIPMVGSVGGSAPISISQSVFVMLVLMVGAFLALVHWVIYSPPFTEHLRR